MIISLDTEATGLDIRHGALPYLVTTSDWDLENTWWTWRVTPETREVEATDEDLNEVQQSIDDAELLILQNPKFDYQGLMSLYRGELRWDWSKVRDTLMASHILASNQPHDLTTLMAVYCGLNVKPYEDRMEKATKEARRYIKSNLPTWRMAQKGLPEMPSAKETVWKYDTWAPAQLAAALGYAEDHEWYTVTDEYANSDSAGTMMLWKVLERLLKKRKLWRIYEERLKLLPVIVEMESRGVTLSGDRLGAQTKEYLAESYKLASKCTSIARRYRYDLELPKSGNNKSLTTFLFDVMKLPTVKTTKKGNPSLDKGAIEIYQTKLEGRKLEFIESLLGKRKRDTALSYMESYQRFWLGVDGHKNYYVLHPSLNPTGTDTLRWSSSNPNEQNISKKEGFNLRYSFGPLPGREWWSLDAKNIELRIPAYESGQVELIELFEQPDVAPYYGSTHLLNFHTVYPDIWDKELKKVGLEKVGPHCKKKYASTWYQWCKNGGFAVQYGAMDTADPDDPDDLATADRAFHRKGSQALLKERFDKLEALNQKYIAMAERLGYVETIPDKTVDPKRGYPLLCTRTSYGRVLPTVPLNYHVQSTAMWWMMKAMIRVRAYLQELNAKLPQPEYFMIMQVHDELVFDFPYRKDRGNMPKIRRIARIMAEGGNDIGIPTPVSIEYHPNNWSESE